MRSHATKNVGVIDTYRLLFTNPNSVIIYKYVTHYCVDNSETLENEHALGAI